MQSRRFKLRAQNRDERLTRSGPLYWCEMLRCCVGHYLNGVRSGLGGTLPRRRQGNWRCRQRFKASSLSLAQGSAEHMALCNVIWVKVGMGRTFGLYYYWDCYLGILSGRTQNTFSGALLVALSLGDGLMKEMAAFRTIPYTLYNQIRNFSLPDTEAFARSKACKEPSLGIQRLTFALLTFDPSVATTQLTRPRSQFWNSYCSQSSSVNT